MAFLSKCSEQEETLNEIRETQKVKFSMFSHMLTKQLIIDKQGTIFITTQVRFRERDQEQDMVQSFKEKQTVMDGR